MKSKVYVPVMLAAAVFSIGLLVSMDMIVRPAYAMTYSTVTTNGTQTEDNCTAITNDNHNHVFMMCGSTTSDLTPNAYAFNEDGTLVGSGFLTGTAPIDEEWQLLPLFSGSSNSTIAKAGNNWFNKLSYLSVNSVVNITGVYNPCSGEIGRRANYDTNGFIWFACDGTTDKIGAFNPVTMSQKVLSPDLTDASGTDCNDPESVFADYVAVDKIYLIVACDISDLVEIFEVDINTTTGAFSFPSDEPIASKSLTLTSAARIYVDTQANRIIYSPGGSSAIDTYTYSSTTGAISSSAEFSSVGNTGNQICTIDDYIVSDIRQLWCVGTNFVQVFVSDSDSFTQEANIGDITIASGGQAGTYLGNEFYVSQGPLNAGSQKFAVFTDTSTIFGEPASPNFGDGTTCATNEIELDTDGDGVADQCAHDSNGDGIIDFNPHDTIIDDDHFGNTAKNFVEQVLGVPAEVAGIFVVIFIISVAEGILFAATRDSFTEVPVFVHALFVFMGVGAGVAMELINVIYLYFLAVAVAASFAISMKMGGGGGD